MCVGVCVTVCAYDVVVKCYLPEEMKKCLVCITLNWL